ncbi:unnamed protein product [Commensalibacter communis]|uniref:hypothetical protein n=1 Tax=Commensalibacter communis TaxID=2972786 RepID=UPI0022FF51A7|nr:hypothetical protein [Commensalibacter communis]CAI3927350.1 unnamed protein product [Commensalibacter communis]CAI3931817.1 unnamed protein product [Commensalibacter communis]
MLIDKYLSYFQFKERHFIVVDAPTDKVFSHAIEYNTQEDLFYKIAICLREFPHRILNYKSYKSAKSFSMEQFTVLESNQEEIVYGLLGRFWELNYGLIPFKNADEFIAFNTPKSAKLVFNFHVTSLKKCKTLLSTETRIYCTDKQSAYQFTCYWYIIRFVSGIIRRRMLKAIAKKSIMSS